MSHMHNPNDSCFKALDRLCAYLKTHSTLGLSYTASPNPLLAAYCDASWNASTEDKGKSVSAYLFFHGNNLIDWSSKRQEIVALSPAESEQNAAFHTAKTAVYFRNLMDELGYTQYHPTTLFEDNTACIAQSKNPVDHGRTRHVGLRYHYLRELVKRKEVQLRYIPTELQLADLLTKPLPPRIFNKLIDSIIRSRTTTSSSSSSASTVRH